MRDGVGLALGVAAALAAMGLRRGSRAEDPPPHIPSSARWQWKALAALPPVVRAVPFRQLAYESREALIEGCWGLFRLQRHDLEKDGLFERKVTVFPTPPVERVYQRGWVEWDYKGDAYVEEMAQTMREAFPPSVRADPERFLDVWLQTFPPIVLERPFAIPLDGSHRSQAARKVGLSWVPAVSIRSWVGEPGESVPAWRWGTKAQQDLFLPWEEPP